MTQKFTLATENSHIVIVEDSPVQAKKLKFLLEENGFEVSTFSNGRDAFSGLKERIPVLIISDIVMPEMDGYDFCSQLKADQSLREVPVILLTSLRDPLDIIKGLQAQADNFITKPYEEQYLLTRIQYLLANRNLRKQGNAEMVMEIIFRGEKYQINSERKQILDLLLSVYEAAIYQNEELVRTQEMLQNSNQELLAANQELEAFTRTVSHDLRSPLNQIIGFVDLLKNSIQGDIDEDKQSYFDYIERITQNMSNLIEDLLSLSRSTRAELVVSNVNLSKIASTIIENLKISEPTRAISVNIMPYLECKGDPGLLTIVMENLLNNAWKYSGKNPQARIEFGKIEKAIVNTYYVKDNGVGFNPAKAHKLFIPFERLHTSNEFVGTGVGLATVKRIIERHGGSIWAESEQGKGATFYFTLPDHFKI